MPRLPRLAATSQEPSGLRTNKRLWWITPSSSDGDETQARNQPTLPDIPVANVWMPPDDSSDR
jgi:hypothetical protein